MSNYSKLLICITVFFSQNLFAQDCNSNVEKESFVEQAVENIHDLTGILNESDKPGLTIAIETYYDFSKALSKDSKMCLSKFHIFSHKMPSTMSTKDVFARSPHIMVLGQGMGFDLSFVSAGALQGQAFVSAVTGVLDFLSVSFGNGTSLGQMYSEINRSGLSNKMLLKSLKICSFSAQRCYNQAMYRLVTLPLTVDPVAYLEKGTSQIFADVLCMFEDYDLLSDLFKYSNEYYAETFSENAVEYFDSNKVVCSGIVGAIESY